MLTFKEIVDSSIVLHTQRLFKSISQVIGKFHLTILPTASIGATIFLTLCLLPMSTTIEIDLRIIIDFLSSVVFFALLIFPVYVYGILIIRALKTLPENTLGLLGIIGVFSMIAFVGTLVLPLGLIGATLVVLYHFIIKKEH